MNTTRVQFQIKNKNKDIEIKNKDVIIELDNKGGGLNYAWFQREENNEPIMGDATNFPDANNGTGGFIRYNDGGKIGTINQADLRKLIINCSSEGEALWLSNILKLKKGKKDASKLPDKTKVKWRFTIDHLKYNDKVEFDPANATTFLNIGGAGGNKNELTLKISDFDGIKNININNYTFEDNKEPVLIDDFSDSARELEKLANISSVLIDKYEKANANLDDETTSINYLKTFDNKSGNAHDDKRIIYGLLKTKLDELVLLLDELAVWRLAGFTKLEQVLKANANGFIINQRTTGNLKVTIGKAGHLGELDNTNGNVTFIKETLNGRKYKGEEIIDPNQKVELTSNWGATFSGKTAPTDSFLIINNMAASEGREWFHKGAIDSFRGNEWFDGNEYKGKTKPQDLRGFSIKDFLKDGRLKNNPASHSVRLKGGNSWKVDPNLGSSPVDQTGKFTRLVFDIWHSSNLAHAIDLAFFGRHFHKADGTISNLIKDDDRYNDISKSTCLLYFNEAEGSGLSKKDHVEIYYNALKSNELGSSDLCYNPATDCYDDAKWENNNLVKNAGSNATDPRQLAKKAHDDIVTFLDLFDKPDYADKSKKTDWEAEKTKLQVYLTKATSEPTSNEGKIGLHWKSKIEEKITTNDNFFGQSPDKKLSDKNVAELDKKINTDEKNDKAKKVYEKFKLQNDSIKNDGVYAELKNIIEELKKTDHDKPSDLEAMGKSGDGKTAWDFINSVDEAKDKDKTTGWAKSVLDKAKADLTSAIEKAEEAMKNEKDAKTQIGITDIKSIKLANAIKELFGYCQESFGKVSSDRLTKLKEIIKAFKDDDTSETKKKEAWDKVNNYHKKTNDEGFGKEALNELEKKTKKNKEDFNSLLETKDVKKAREKFESIEDSSGLTEDDLKRCQVAIILEKNNKKELFEIFKVESIDNYEDGDDKINDSITTLKKHITEIQKLINATDDNNEDGKVKKIIQEINEQDKKFGDAKAFLENWVGKLKERQRVLESKVNKKKQNIPNQDETDKPFYTRTPFIVLVFAIFIVAILWVAYSALKKSDDAEEE